jgi:hypothetical protein
MTQLLEIKEENGLIIKVYAPAPIKPSISAKNKTSTKLSRSEIKAIQCLKEVSNEKTN